ncbi:MAG: hypothetical protein KAY32_15370 [Candidatus Eisenbacteria sp.]|nr:hypothetical protein [Candidatus Eisenbacteria bacterium]
MRTVKLTDRAKNQVGILLTQKATIESNLAIYIQGYLDAHGLDGDWNLDTEKWILTEMHKAPKEKV